MFYLEISYTGNQEGWILVIAATWLCTHLIYTLVLRGELLILYTITRITLANICRDKQTHAALDNNMQKESISRFRA